MLLAAALAYLCAWNPPAPPDSLPGAGIRAELGDGGAYLVILTVCCVGIALRRVGPTAAVVVIGAALTGHVLIYDELSVLAVAACLVAAETCASRVPRPHAWLLLGLGYFGGAVGSLRAANELINPPVPGSELIILTVTWAFITVAVLVGLLRRRSRERVEQALERARILASRQEAERHLAVSAERQRVARDVHDLLGHSLSVIGMQAEGARAVLSTDPDAAAQALAVIGSTSRRAVAEVHSLVDMLGADREAPTAAQAVTRPDGTGAPAGALPGLDDIPRLVAQVRRAGVPLTLDLRYYAEPPAPVGAAVYRCAQEALTNVMRHASGATASVRILADEDRIDLVVENGLPGPAGGVAAGTAARRGKGLTTMRERAAAVGGHLEAGECTEGGWRVHAVVPASPTGTGVQEPARPGEAA
ncbi:sensor histidine kinase [Actinomyces qiguomingii]|nr:histidine kinase [Actinomyces qiguomingii]